MDLAEEITFFAPSTILALLQERQIATTTNFVILALKLVERLNGRTDRSSLIRRTDFDNDLLN